jgi:tetratricopeptide (TPR) repeat protein
MLVSHWWEDAAPTRGEESGLLMGQANRENKGLDFQISFYEGILQQAPDLVDVLIPLGDAYTKRGLHEKGLEVDLRLTRLRPKDPIVFYNLACSYSLLGQMDAALESMERALALGYKDFDFLMSDSDLESLRKDPRLGQLLRKYGRKKERSAS